jgi:hypothetical protein
MRSLVAWNTASDKLNQAGESQSHPHFLHVTIKVDRPLRYRYLWADTLIRRNVSKYLPSIYLVDSSILFTTGSRKSCFNCNGISFSSFDAWRQIYIFLHQAQKLIFLDSNIGAFFPIIIRNATPPFYCRAF